MFLKSSLLDTINTRSICTAIASSHHTTLQHHLACSSTGKARYLSSLPQKNAENKSTMESRKSDVPVAEESHTHSHSETHSHSHNSSDHDGHSHSLFGHSHSHSQPNELLVTNASSILSNPAVRITWIGLLVNVAMAVSKGLGGVYFHSQSLVADAIHSVSDMVADFLTLGTVNVASKIGAPDHYPLGYGKIECVGSLLVSGVLLFAGVSVGWSSLLQVFEFTLPSYIYDYVSAIQIGHSHSHDLTIKSPDDSHSHSHSHSHVAEVEHATREVPNVNAAWLAGGSIIVKELLFRKTLNVANATNSKVLVANAWHHRVDSLTSLVALITVTGGIMFNIAWLDSIGGLCVSVLIIKAGWGTFKTSWYELVDRGEKQGDEVYDKIHGIVVLELDANLKDFKLDELLVMCAGANTNIFVTLRTDKSTFNLIELNEAEEKLKKLIKHDDKFIRNIQVRFKYADST